MSLKISKILLFSLIIGFYGFCFPHTALADKSYSINNVNLNLQVKTDGSMDVEETRTYSFNGSYTFAYQYINKNPDQTTNPGRTEPYKLTNFQICEETSCYKQLTTDLTI